MSTYSRMAVLAQLNEDLKEFNPDYYTTRNLIRHNQIQMLKNEPDESRESMLRVFKLAEKEVFKKKEKAILIDRRWLSDGSLEFVWRCPDGEIFTTNSQENTSDYEIEGAREKSKARDDKIENEKKNVTKVFNEFSMYFTWTKQQKENKKLMELYS